jgi:hypothetical protein
LVVVLLYFSAYYPGLLAARAAAEEASAAAVLRHIGSCATAYESKHHTYPSGLEAMGPAGEGCLDAATVAGRRREYRFSYTPAPAGAEGRVATYCAEARPVEYQGRLTRSFLLDESGVMRFTDQRRAANANDPPLQ